MAATLDRDQVRDFANRLLGLYTGGFVTLMIEIGHQQGLFEVAAQGPGTSEELARRAGRSERHVREWLGAMVTGGIFDYEPGGAVYTLPAEHAACLVGTSPYNMAPRSLSLSRLAKLVPQVSATFQSGGGVPYDAYMPDFTELMDNLGRLRYDNLLVGVYLPLAAGLPERLAQGIRVADIGSGSGHVANLMAAAFPRSTFTGFDLSEHGLSVSRAEATSMGLGNVTFEKLDLAELPAEPNYDLITAFDVIHDQVAPATVLSRVAQALAPGGTFFMYDIRASSRLEENTGNPLTPYLYSVSVMHCMQVSLAHGGAGLGTCWGEQLARQMLAEAGFTNVKTFEPRLDVTNLVYVCKR